MAALQGLLAAKPVTTDSPGYSIPEDAVRFADATLAELAKKK